jgi:hypothetical protein
MDYDQYCKKWFNRVKGKKIRYEGWPSSYKGYVVPTKLLKGDFICDVYSQEKILKRVCYPVSNKWYLFKVIDTKLGKLYYD